MKERIIQGALVAWMTIVLATHWILASGFGFRAAEKKIPVLRTMQEILSSWFYAPYGP
jgi:hypothetical protein